MEVRSSKLRWGVLGVAKIAVEKVIPAMQRGAYSQISAIASREAAKAESAARRLGIPKSYGSYDALLADPDIDAVYIPLPNHLHVPWSLRCLEAGKHVLCEKPLGMSAAEAVQLAEAARLKPRLLVMEAFMYRFHPQWRKALKLVQQGGVGRLRTVHSFFSFFLDDSQNVRNVADMGGGGLMDLGCYAVSIPRCLFGREPERVLGLLEIDPRFQVDRLASGLLDFGDATATFTCGTQLSSYQRVQIFGEEGRIEVEIPLNAPKDRPCRIWLQTRSRQEEILLEICDQYTIQGDLFSQAALQGAPAPTPLEDAIANMRVIDALRESSQTMEWKSL